MESVVEIEETLISFLGCFAAPFLTLGISATLSFKKKEPRNFFRGFFFMLVRHFAVQRRARCPPSRNIRCFCFWRVVIEETLISFLGCFAAPFLTSRISATLSFKKKEPRNFFRGFFFMLVRHFAVQRRARCPPSRNIGCFAFERLKYALGCFATPPLPPLGTSFLSSKGIGEGKDTKKSPGISSEALSLC